LNGPIPAWGLYRLLKALESRSVAGVLDLQVAGGHVAFLLDGGTPVAARSTLAGLSFEGFLAHTRAAANGPVTTAADLAARGASRDDAARMQHAHARAVLSSLLPSPVSGWSLAAGASPDWAVPGQGIDVTAELMRAAAQSADLDMMRSVLARYRRGGWITLADGAEPLLSAAKSVGDAKVLYLLRQGRSREVGEGVLADDTNVRVLFALVVAGAIARDPSGAVSQAIARSGAPAAPPDDESPAALELRAGAAEVARANLYEVLGVSVDARISQIECAHRRALRRFAPGRFEGAGPDAPSILDQVRARMEEARMTLTDRALRTSYNRAVGVTTAALDARIAEMFEARAIYQTGVDLVQARRYDEALAQFEAAATRDPGEPEYEVAIAKILVARPPAPGQIERARSLAEHALATEPELVAAILALASVCRVEQKREEAAELIRRALRIDPDNSEAAAARDLLQPALKPNKMSFLKKRDSVVDRIRESVMDGIRRIRKKPAP